MMVGSPLSLLPYNTLTFIYSQYLNDQLNNLLPPYHKHILKRQCTHTILIPYYFSSHKNERKRQKVGNSERSNTNITYITVVTLKVANIVAVLLICHRRKYCPDCDKFAEMLMNGQNALYVNASRDIVTDPSQLEIFTVRITLAVLSSRQRSCRSQRFVFIPSPPNKTLPRQILPQHPCRFRYSPRTFASGFLFSSNLSLITCQVFSCEHFQLWMFVFL